MRSARLCLGTGPHHTTCILQRSDSYQTDPPRSNCHNTGLFCTRSTLSLLEEKRVRQHSPHMQSRDLHRDRQCWVHTPCRSELVTRSTSHCCTDRRRCWVQSPSLPDQGRNLCTLAQPAQRTDLQHTLHRESRDRGLGLPNQRHIRRRLWWHRDCTCPSRTCCREKQGQSRRRLFLLYNQCKRRCLVHCTRRLHRRHRVWRGPSPSQHDRRHSWYSLFHHQLRSGRVDRACTALMGRCRSPLCLLRSLCSSWLLRRSADPCCTPHKESMHLSHRPCDPPHKTCMQWHQLTNADLHCTRCIQPDQLSPHMYQLCTHRTISG